MKRSTPLTAVTKLGNRLRAGFSLIEVNMAIFVLAGGALALLGLFPLGLRESNAARNEMRTTAFCERFLGAARVAAEQKDVKTREGLLDAIEGDFGFRIGEPIEWDGPELKAEAVEDPENTGVWYYAWARPVDSTNRDDIDEVQGQMETVQLCVQATTTNCRGTYIPLLRAPVYAVTVFVSGKN